MIFKELEQLAEKGLLDKEHLQKYNVKDIIEEECELLNSDMELNYMTYSNSILITSKFVTDENQDELIVANPFFEKFLLQQLFLQAKGIPSIYMQVLIIMNGISESYTRINNYLRTVSCYNEYKDLEHEYERYVNMSLSSLKLQTKILNEFMNVDMNILQEKLDTFKELISPEE